MKGPVTALLASCTICVVAGDVAAQSFSNPGVAPSLSSPTEAQYNGASAMTSTSWTVTANCPSGTDCLVRLTPPSNNPAVSAAAPLLWRYAATPIGSGGGCVSFLATPAFVPISSTQVILTVKKNQSCTIQLQFQTTLVSPNSWAVLNLTTGPTYIQNVGIRIGTP